MAASPSANLEELTRTLASRADVWLVHLFGSAVPGDLRDSSDIDMLVVHTAKADRVAIEEVVERLTADSEKKVSCLLFSASELRAEASNRPSFVAHLADAGRTLFRRRGSIDLQALKSRAVTPQSLAAELRERSQQVEVFEHVERFGGEFVPSLAHLYAIARSVVILKLLAQGSPEYNWERMFKVMATRQPELRRDLEWLESLRKFYDHTRGRARLEEPRVAPTAAAVLRSIRAVESVAAA